MVVYCPSRSKRCFCLLRNMVLQPLTFSCRETWDLKLSFRERRSVSERLTASKIRSRLSSKRRRFRLLHLLSAWLRATWFLIVRSESDHGLRRLLCHPSCLEKKGERVVSRSLVTHVVWNLWKVHSQTMRHCRIIVLSFLHWTSLILDDLGHLLHLLCH